MMKEKWRTARRVNTAITRRARETKGIYKVYVCQTETMEMDVRIDRRRQKGKHGVRMERERGSKAGMGEDGGDKHKSEEETTEKRRVTKARRASSGEGCVTGRRGCQTFYEASVALRVSTK